MAKRKARKFDLSGIKGLDIQSVTIVETTADDLIAAAERCAMPDSGDGTPALDNNTYGIVLRAQQISGAIVEVEGEPIRGASCQAYMKWSARTRYFVGKAYDSLNSATPAEDALFDKILAAPDVVDLPVGQPEQD